MRRVTNVVAAFVSAISLWTLWIYLSALLPLWEAREGIELNSFQETSLRVYRERGPDGKPAILYKLAPYFSIIDPLDGPNWEIRIPGFIPAGLALATLGWAGSVFYPRKSRG